jgi:hypothetical protein
MYRDCQSLAARVFGEEDKITLPPRSDANQYWGFMRALHQCAVLADGQGRTLLGACPPTDTKTTWVLHVFVEYVRTHPEKSSLPAAAAAYNAMAATARWLRKNPAPYDWETRI